ncbi:MULTISPECIES: LmeA family phospholipid-binding protein [unclassified Curtobacterium]|uniref:LmeA family phospholipid-binding protein n=1 Tax=unclassified Curtobacterium TaxID=257496 RepID=UPI000826C94E|nr:MULTISPECIES: LmeA family phospholipid-binding protein [unclassified Curtobacterium]WIA95435.1 LmeA family phospholipid-binding protein [Curtobacterium sp. MCBA15_004]WIA98801.1 LmeA family phospholipid-binding protein [Curtobacterium sp. MCBA15_012]
MSVAPAPSRRRRRWPIVLVVVLLVLAALVVVAEFVLRGVVDRVIADQVEQSLPEGATGEVTAHAEGVVLPQLVTGTLDRVDIRSDRLTVDGVPLAADVTVHDVPVDGKGDVRDVDGTVTLASSSVKDLAKYSPLFDRLTLVDGGVELSGSTAVLGYDITYAATGDVAAERDGRGVTITPKGVRITNSDLGLKVNSIPGVTDVPVQVCTAQFLPEQLRVRALDVTARQATVRVTADRLPLTEQGLRTVGSCSG